MGTVHLQLCILQLGLNAKCNGHCNDLVRVSESEQMSEGLSEIE